VVQENNVVPKQPDGKPAIVVKWDVRLKTEIKPPVEYAFTDSQIR
jgi:hypothetical protein